MKTYGNKVYLYIYNYKFLDAQGTSGYNDMKHWKNKINKQVLLNPAPTSTQLPSIFLQHPQCYKNQNITIGQFP